VWQIPDAVDTVVCAPDDGWKYHPKHVEQFPDINKLRNVASCRLYIGILLGAHPILHISRIRVKLRHRRQTGGVLLYGASNNSADWLEEKWCNVSRTEQYGACTLLLSNTFAPYLSNRFTVDHVRVLCIGRHMCLRSRHAPYKELGLNCYF
jgi:hypothetical protein